MAAGFDDLEAALLQRRNTTADVGGAFDAAWAVVGGRCGLPSGLHEAGERLAAVVQARPGTAAEPAYHNRHHAAEATLAMGWLCRAALDLGLLSETEAAIGIVAMVGHDLDHDGSTLGGGVLEARAWAAVHPVAAAAGLSPATLAALGDVILGTDPALVAINAARVRGDAPAGPAGAGHDLLRMLANEADVFASMLPRLGPALSLLLAEEWRPSGNAALLRVGTAAGRCAFLQAYPAMSDPAIALGLEAARGRCLAAYATVARRLRQGCSAEAGCAALDAMPADAGWAAYAAALDDG